MFELSSNSVLNLRIHSSAKSIVNQPPHSWPFLSRGSYGARNMDKTSGMVIDFGFFEQSLEKVRDALDHRLLDEVEGLGPEQWKIFVHSSGGTLRPI